MNLFIKEFLKIIGNSNYSTYASASNDIHYFEYLNDKIVGRPVSWPTQSAVFFHMMKSMILTYREDIVPSMIEAIRNFEFKSFTQVRFVLTIIGDISDQQLSDGIVNIIINDENQTIKNFLKDCHHYNRIDDFVSLYDIASDKQKLDVYFFFSEDITKNYPKDMAWLRKNTSACWANYLMSCGIRGEKFAKLLTKTTVARRKRVISAFKRYWNPSSNVVGDPWQHSPNVGLINFSTLSEDCYKFLVNKIAELFPIALTEGARREIDHLVRSCIPAMKKEDRLKLISTLRKNAEGNAEAFMHLIDEYYMIWGTKADAQEEINKIKNLM